MIVDSSFRWNDTGVALPRDGRWEMGVKRAWNFSFFNHRFAVQTRCHPAIFSVCEIRAIRGLDDRGFRVGARNDPPNKTAGFAALNMLPEIGFGFGLDLSNPRSASLRAGSCDFRFTICYFLLLRSRFAGGMNRFLRFGWNDVGVAIARIGGGGQGNRI